MKRTRLVKDDQGNAPSVAGLSDVAIDYPTEGMTIASASYTFRMGASGNAEKVEVCINEGPWQACRHDSGYWWYDWSGSKPSQYRLRARMLDKDGNESRSSMRRFRFNGPE